MSIDRIVIISVWVITIIGLIAFTPRNEIREAWVIFMFKQAQTWLFGLLAVQYGLITYPVREFPNATATSFSFEYFIYPAICIVFVLRYPVRKPLYYRIGWYALFPTWMTILEVLIEHNTRLVHYTNWTWYWTWITLLLTFSFSRMFYLWFMKKGVPRRQA